LRITNPQTTAWLIVKGTNINYPVVQAHDNSFYLNHSYTGTLNSSGWVFMDYEDDPEFNNQNTVIYAHGRNEGTMFGTLKYALNAWWQNNPDNHIVVTATPTQLMFWETFSVYRIPNTSDYINVNFSNEANFTSFINRVTDRSAHNFGIRPTATDRILTLSTCIGTDERMVLHARLRETIKK
jgi:sortase B